MMKCCYGNCWKSGTWRHISQSITSTIFTEVVKNVFSLFSKCKWNVLMTQYLTKNYLENLFSKIILVKCTLEPWKTTNPTPLWDLEHEKSAYTFLITLKTLNSLKGFLIFKYIPNISIYISNISVLDIIILKKKTKM